MNTIENKDLNVISTFEDNNFSDMMKEDTNKLTNKLFKLLLSKDLDTNGDFNYVVNLTANTFSNLLKRLLSAYDVKIEDRLKIHMECIKQVNNIWDDIIKNFSDSL